MSSGIPDAVDDLAVVHQVEQILYDEAPFGPRITVVRLLDTRSNGMNVEHNAIVAGWRPICL